MTGTDLIVVGGIKRLLRSEKAPPNTYSTSALAYFTTKARLNGAVSVHFIDSKSWDRKVDILRLLPFRFSHTGKAIRETVGVVLESFKLAAVDYNYLLYCFRKRLPILIRLIDCNDCRGS